MCSFSALISPVIDSLMPKYLNASVGFRYVMHPAPRVRSPTQIACSFRKSYPDISDFLRFTFTPDQSEKLSTVFSNLCMASLLSVSNVPSSANRSVLYSSPELCLCPPPLLSNHRMSALTTTPPSIGDSGHPCRSPRSRFILAVLFPFSCTTWK